MKKIFIFSILALAAVSCTNNTYNVLGTLEGLDLEGKTIYLTDFVDKSRVDSTMVEEDGTFSFEGKIDTARYVQLNVSNQFYSEMVLEPGKILVDTMDLNWGQALTYGTPLNDKHKEFSLTCQGIQEKLETKFQQLEANTDISSIEKQAKLLKYKINSTEQIKETVKQFITNNTQNIIGAVTLSEVSSLFSNKEFNALYVNMGELQKAFIPLQRTIEIIKKKALTAEGQQYIDFTIENGNVDGTKASLSDYVGKGKMVLVDFWASWCGPCIQEIPTLKKVYKKYGKKVTILSVAVWDKRAATLKAIEEHNTPWAQIVDAGQIPTDIYGISSIPHIMLIGEDGTIINRNIRGAQIEEAIKANL